MQTEVVRPEGFVVFMQSLKCGLKLSDEGAGRVFKAAARYFLEETEPEEVGGFECAERIVYDLLQEDILKSLKKHQRTVARNRRIASSRRGAPLPDAVAEDDAVPLVTTGDDSHLTERNQTELNRTELNQTELNQTELNQTEQKRESTAAVPPTHAHGDYGWVKLTEAQYAQLLRELGEQELLRCIRYVDESAQQTGNKNKWRDWNLVLRKCSREGWGRRKNNDKGGHLANAGQSEKRRFSFRYDVE